MAVRVALAATLCMFVNLDLRLPVGYLAPLGACLMLIVGTGNVPRLAVQGYSATLVSGALAVAMTALFAESPLLYLLVMLVYLVLWLACLTPLFLAQMLGGIIIAMVLFTDLLVAPTAVGELYIHFHQQMALGFLVAAAVDRWVWPERPRDALFRQLALLFQDLGHLLGSLRVSTSPPDVSPGPAFNHLLVLMGQVKQGRDPPGQPYLRWAARYRLLWGRVAYVRSHYPSAFRSGVDSSETGNNAVETLEERCARLEQAALRMERIPQPDYGPDGDPLQDGAPPMPAAGRSGDRDFAAVTRRRVLQSAAGDLSALEAHYNHIVAAGEAPAPAPGPWFGTTRESWRLALKTALIVLLAILGERYFNLPGSTVVSFYAVSFGLISNLGQVNLRGRIGVIGVAAALGYGFLALGLLTVAPHLALHAALFFLGVLLSAYAAYGSERTAFAGLQAALIMSYIFLVHEGPEWSLELALTRAAALMVAGLIALLVHRLVWPVSPLRQLRDEVAQTLVPLGHAIVGLQAAGTAPHRPVADLATARLAISRMLRDAQYLVGERAPVVQNYLEIIHALDRVLVEFQTLNVVRERYTDNPLIDDLLSGAGPDIEALGRGYVDAGEALGRGTRPRRGGDGPSVPPLAEADDLVNPEQRREAEVARSNLAGMTEALARIRGAVAALADNPEPRRRTSSNPVN